MVKISSLVVCFVIEVLGYPRVEEDISDVISCILVFAEHVLEQVNALDADMIPRLSIIE